MLKVQHQELVNILGAKKVGGSYKARCPAHDDKNLSLSIGENDDGHAIFKCFAGCSQESVTKAILNKWPHLSKAPQPTKQYFYRDKSGKPVLRVSRTHDKKFFQHKYVDGLWVRGSVEQGFQLYLYEKWKSKTYVVLVEGEKDAESLDAIGVRATTSPKGANAWKEYYAEQFEDKKVFILPDNDKAGRAFAHKAYKDIKKYAKLVKIVELPGLREKEDVSDWLAKGNGKRQLVELLKTSQDAFSKQTHELENKAVAEIKGLISLDTVQPEEVHHFWYPYIPVAKLTNIEGRPGVGKGWFVAQIATTISTGGSFPNGPPVKAGNVLIFNNEDGLGDTIVPRLKKLGANLSRIKAYQEPLELNQEGIERVVNMAEVVKPSLIVLDPIQCYMGGRDINRANETRAALAPLIEVARKFNCAILIVRHIKKGNDKAINMGIGSTDFVGAVRSVLATGQDPTNSNHRVMAHTKCNLAPAGLSYSFSLEDNAFQWIGESNLTADEIFESSNDNSEKRSAIDEAKDFLEEMLSDGPVLSSVVLKQANSLDIAKRTLTRAKEILEVKSKKEGNQWFYTFQTKKTSQESQTSRQKTLAPLPPSFEAGDKEISIGTIMGTPDYMNHQRDESRDRGEL